jgi:uncharacterized membrane protein
MFFDEETMDYQRHYDHLIEKYGTWEKPKGVYTERHRKLPGCMGGAYVKGNAFYMSARAHFVAHLLLVKIYPGEINILRAASIAGRKNGFKLSSRFYAILKKAYASDEALKERGRATIENARRIFRANPEAVEAQRKHAIELGKRSGPTVGLSNLKKFTAEHPEKLSEFGKRGAEKLNQIISSTPEIKAKVVAAGLRGAAKSKQLWQIPEYRTARMNNDVETYQRITREFKS